MPQSSPDGQDPKTSDCSSTILVPQAVLAAVLHAGSESYGVCLQGGLICLVLYNSFAEGKPC